MNSGTRKCLAAKPGSFVDSRGSIGSAGAAGTRKSISTIIRITLAAIGQKAARDFALSKSQKSEDFRLRPASSGVAFPITLGRGTCARNCCSRCCAVFWPVAQVHRAKSPHYVSPVQYQSLSCQQLIQEGERVSQRANQLAGVQDEKSTNDAVATGVGVILFWPSLFFIKGDGQTAAELGRLRGEYDAIQQASIMKNCEVRFQERQAPPATTGSVSPAR